MLSLDKIDKKIRSIKLEWHDLLQNDYKLLDHMRLNCGIIFHKVRKKLMKNESMGEKNFSKVISLASGSI